MAQAGKPTVNLVAWNNGVGLSRDLALLERALRERGYGVHVTAVGRGKLRKWFRPPLMRVLGALRRLAGLGPRFDVNLMLEHLRAEDLPSARCTVFIPNPEWCGEGDVALLPRTAGVIAKTHHADAIFAALGARTAYAGFTSEDRYDAAVPREARFFHLAGRSSNKGTDALIRVWQRHPEWPRLTIVQSPRTARPVNPPAANIEHRVDYLDDAELRRLQNACRYHLCLSETEGFGHYLVEAMSVGAVTLTTDAPPMNELVTPERGVLVASDRTGRQQLATTYFVSEPALERAVEHALRMDETQRDALSARARAWFVQNHAQFATRLDTALRTLLD